jgi:spermidine/putrescine transport system ATP-binding protein
MPPFRRPINTVFPSYALSPNMTVADNIGFGLRMLGRSKAEVANRVADMLRKELQLKLKRMRHEIGITFIFVTHDQEEALTMSDRIAVMNHGRLLQVGNPHEIHDAPADRFVAGFIGETNLLKGRVRSVTDGTAEVALADGVLLTADATGACAGESAAMSVSL